MIDFEGGTLLDIGARLAFKHTRGTSQEYSQTRYCSNSFAPFLFARTLKPGAKRAALAVMKPASSAIAAKAMTISLLSSFTMISRMSFTSCFWVEHMVYTCAYFAEWGNASRSRRNIDKLDMICRKLRLQERESAFLILAVAGAG